MPIHWEQNHPVAKEESILESWLKWAKTHQEAVAVFGIFFLLICFGLPYYLYSRAKNEKDAINVFNLGQYYFHSQVDSKKGQFKTNTDKFQQALQAFQRITTDYRGTKVSRISAFYAGKCQFFLGQYVPAYSSFDFASRELKDSPLGSEASLGKILCLEAQNEIPQAIILAELFLKESPDSFIAQDVRICLAELYVKNKDEQKAIEILQMISKGQSESTWRKEAVYRLENLKS